MAIFAWRSYVESSIAYLERKVRALEQNEKDQAKAIGDRITAVEKDLAVLCSKAHLNKVKELRDRKIDKQIDEIRRLLREE